MKKSKIQIKVEKKINDFEKELKIITNDVNDFEKLRDIKTEQLKLLKELLDND